MELYKYIVLSNGECFYSFRWAYRRLRAVNHIQTSLTIFGYNNDAIVMMNDYALLKGIICAHTKAPYNRG